MTRIAYISDLHFEYRTQLMMPVMEGKIHRLTKIGFPERLGADILVIAGDVHPNPAIQRLLGKGLRDHYQRPVVMVPGNHDCYDREFPDHDPGTVCQVEGLRIAHATLWTHLTPGDAVHAPGHSDFKHIRGITVERWNACHARQVETLKSAGADLIVTHFAPSKLSRHPRFDSHHKNAFYMNNLSLADFPTARAWIHGHVHDPCDYVIGNTRVVCNPVGYPMEKHLGEPVMRYIDI